MTDKPTYSEEEEELHCIPCMPLWAFSKPPTDGGQTGSKIEECPNCKEKMWTTDRKRKKKEECPTWIMLCAMCVCIEARDRGREIEFIDLSKIN